MEKTEDAVRRFRHRFAGVIVLLAFIVVGATMCGVFLYAEFTNANRFYPGGLSLALGGDGFSIGGDTQLKRGSANVWLLGAGDSLIGATWINGTGASVESIYIDGVRFYPMNSGSVSNCYNGTWIAHGLPGDPAATGSIALSLRGPSQYNATRILLVPTVLTSNATHFNIEFLAWETAGWTLVPVVKSMNQTVWWMATYKP